MTETADEDLEHAAGDARRAELLQIGRDLMRQSQRVLEELDAALDASEDA